MEVLRSTVNNTIRVLVIYERVELCVTFKMKLFLGGDGDGGGGDACLVTALV